jgi:hypothetical protein
MKRVVKLTEKDLNNLVKRVISEQELEENIFDNIKNAVGNVKDAYRGAKGIYRGYGMDYFKHMSRLERLIKELKRLDIPNEKVMNELTDLKTKVSTLNMPTDRKNKLIALIDNSLYHFNEYSKINDQILSKIQTLNIDSWK